MNMFGVGASVIVCTLGALYVHICTERKTEKQGVTGQPEKARGRIRERARERQKYQDGESARETQ